MPVSEPSYTMQVWHRSDGKATASLSGPEDWEPDYVEIAEDLTAFADGFLNATGYKSAWYQGLLDERWYVVGGFVLGSTVTGVLCALSFG